MFECVELELALKLATGDEEDPLESDFSCPIKLHQGRVVVQLVAVYSMNLGSSYLCVFIGVRQTGGQSKDLPDALNKGASLGGVPVLAQGQITHGQY